MKSNRTSFIVAGALVLVLSLLVLLIIRPIDKAASARHCRGNLGQIGRMMELYRSTYGGPDRLLPTSPQGEALFGRAWLDRFRETTLAPHGYSQILSCPFRGKRDRYGYRGPAFDLNLSSGYDPSVPIIGDHPGNHGAADSAGVNVLTRGYQVIGILPNQESKWREFLEKTGD